MKFTDRRIKNLKPGAERYIEWEEKTGLGIRVSPKGRKTWVFMYRFEGRPRMMSLGTYPATSVAKAHKARGDALADLERKIDPGDRLVETHQQDRSAPTIRTLKEEYLEKWAKQHKRTWQEDERMLEKDVIPTWGRRKAKDIKRRDVIRLIDGIVERGAPIVANRTLEVIRKMFNFAIEQDIIQTNPCVMVRAPGKETQRDRVLSEDEIKTFWDALEWTDSAEVDDDIKLQMSRGTRLALKLLLLTAQRRGEVAAAEIAEFELKARWWTIPGRKSKNGLSHRVPLSPQAMRVVKEAIELSGGSPFLFPSPRAGKSITASSLTKAVNRNRDKIGVDNFSAHDLRRTAASYMTGSGTDRLVVSKLLNHVESGITAVYDRHSYDKEKRQALNAWGRMLQQILGGDLPDTSSR
jgi:integrase